MSEPQHLYTMLVVDDAPENIDLLYDILKPYYQVKVANGGEKALKIIASDHPPDLILLDIMMPGIDGYEVCRRVKADPKRHHIPIMFITSMDEQKDEEFGLGLGAEDFIAKPFSPAIVLARIKTHLALYNQTRELEHLVDLRTEELERTRMQIIHRLGRAAEFRDNETGFHVVRMAHFSKLIAIAAGVDAATAETLFLAAPMHDVGKIATPDHILLKPSKLNPVEWRIMKLHAEAGAEIIGDHEDALLVMARSIALSHHEKWDGSGYPIGLRGENIPLYSRIVAIADVFDALTSERPYKKAWSIEQATGTIREGMGSHFDPSLLQPFLASLPEMLKVKESFSDVLGPPSAGLAPQPD
jgi:putative two-component system response regulator